MGNLAKGSPLIKKLIFFKIYKTLSVQRYKKVGNIGTFANKGDRETNSDVW